MLIMSPPTLYNSVILPLLDYYSSIWDPHALGDINQLESVQAFATKIITKNWQSDHNHRLHQLNIPRLADCRRRQKVQLCFRIVTGYSVIPSSFFTPQPSPYLCIMITYPSIIARPIKLPISLHFVSLLSTIHSGFCLFFCPL